METYIDNVLREFEKNFPYQGAILEDNGTYYTFKHIQDFIKQKLEQALDQQKEDLVRKLEGEKKELEHDDCVVGHEYCECLEWEKHNQALDRAIEVIRRLT